MDDNELLWRIYQEHCVWERHHEDQRASATNILVAVAAGVIGVMVLDGGLSDAHFALPLLLLIVGVFGAALSNKQYERFARHQTLANTYRRALDERFPNSSLIALREEGDLAHRARYPPLADPAKIRLFHLWMAIHVLVAIFGFVLVIVALVR